MYRFNLLPADLIPHCRSERPWAPLCRCTSERSTVRTSATRALPPINGSRSRRERPRCSMANRIASTGSGKSMGQCLSSQASTNVTNTSSRHREAMCAQNQPPSLRLGMKPNGRAEAQSLSNTVHLIATMCHSNISILAKRPVLASQALIRSSISWSLCDIAVVLIGLISKAAYVLPGITAGSSHLPRLFGPRKEMTLY